MNKDTLLLITDIHNYFFFREKRKKEKEDAVDLRLRIELFDDNKPRYNQTAIGLFFVTKDNEQITKMVSCRDYLNESFRIALYEGSGSYWKRGYPKPELDELRLVIWSSSLNNQKIDAGLKVVNMYARLADWPKTKAYSARIEDQGGKWLNAYLLVGPKEWQKYPQLLSLFILFFRLAKVITIPRSVNDPYALECVWHEAVECERKRYAGGYEPKVDIHTFLPDCYKKLIVLMKNEKEIFDAGLEEAWPKSCDYRTGIYSMCRQTSIHPAADAKLQKFYLKEMEKHPKCWR